MQENAWLFGGLGFGVQGLGLRIQGFEATGVETGWFDRFYGLHKSGLGLKLGFERV